MNKIFWIVGILAVVGGAIFGIGLLIQKITGVWHWEGWVIYILILIVIAICIALSGAVKMFGDLFDGVTRAFWDRN